MKNRILGGKSFLPLFICRFLVGIIIMVAQVTSWASTGFREEEVSSSNAPGAPYLVVMKDASGNSDFKEEGIYVRRSKEAQQDSLWKLALSGRVSSTITGPLLDELKITSVSKRYESLVLMDEKLTLFSIYSQEKKLKSFIQFGAGQNLLRDVVAKRDIALPPISSPDDVEIYQASLGLGQNFQAVVVSIRDPFYSTERGGYTFAFMVTAGDRDGDLELVDQPILLDYEFHKSKDLRKYLNANAEGVRGFYSPHMLQTIVADEGKDSGPIALWKTQLQDFLTNSPTPPKALKMDQVPYYSVDSKTFVYPNSEIKSLVIPSNGGVSRNNNIIVEQHYILGGQNYVLCRTGNGSEKILGEVNVDEDGKYLVYNDGAGHALFVVNGDLYYADENENSALPIKLITQFVREGQPRKITFKLVSGHDFDNLILSTENAEGSETIYFAIRHSDEGSLYVNKRYSIEHKFYSFNELTWRVKELEEGRVFFDNKTPVTESAPAYRQAYSPKNIHLLLGPDRLSKTFIGPLNEFAVGSGMVFREYQTVEDVEVSDNSRTGIHIVNKEGQTSRVFEGQILGKPESAQDYDWARENISIKDANGGKPTKRALRVNLVDSTFNSGKQSATALITLEGNEIGALSITEVPLEWKEGFDLTDITIVPSMNDLGVFHVFFITRNAESGEVSMHKISGQAAFLSEYGGKRAAIKMNDSYPSEFSVYPPDIDVADRIVYDEDGIPYWVSDLSVETDNENYMLYTLDELAKIRPNADSKYATKRFHSYKEAMEKAGTQKLQKGAEAFAWLLKTSRVKTSKLLEGMDEKVGSGVRMDLFPRVLTMLDEMATKSSSPSHQVLVVPDEIKPHIKKIILNYWLNTDGHRGGFSIKNPHLEFYAFGETPSTDQSHLMKQLRIPESSKQRSKAFMYADASAITQLARVKSVEMSDDKIFQISDDQEQEGNLFDSSGESKVNPHALYLLASEGRRIDTPEFMKNGEKATYSQLILASESEWAKLKDEASLEFSYGLDEHFQVTNLGAPGFEEQMNLFKEVFEDREVMRLGYKFDSGAKKADELSAEENKNRLIKYMISRIEALSKEQNKSELIAFSDILIKFKNSLLRDEEVRRVGMVDRGLVERTLAKVFTLPLKLKYLPEGDPLRQLSSPDILMRIQNEGKYPGPFDVTKQVVDTILSQTRQEAALKIPSSIILDGKSGTGKTQLVLSLITTLKLKTYDFNKDPLSEDNLQAQAFVLHIPKLTTSSSAVGLMNVDKALEHLEHFLSLPFGHRGFIVLDDLHLCTDEVRSKVISRLRTLIDADDGMVHVKSPFKKEAAYENFPSRNLTIAMTYNPAEREDNTANNATFLSNSRNKEERGMKALGGKNVQVDRAFFKRFGLYLIMDEFSVEAKGPGLIEKWMAQSRDFYQDGNFVTLSKGVIENVVNKFAKRDARNFFSNAVNGLGELVTDSVGRDDDGVKIIVTRRNVVVEEEGDSEESMKHFIENNLVVLDIGLSNPESLLQFQNLIVNSFRTDIYEGLVKSLISHPKFAANEQVEAAVLSGVMQAMVDHLGNHASLTPIAMRLDPTDFGVKSSLELSDFNREILEMSGVSADSLETSERPSYFPEMFKTPRSSESLFESVVNAIDRTVSERTRKDVNSEYVGKIKGILKEFLMEKLNLSSLDDMPDADEWLSEIHRESQKEESLEKLGALGAGKKITDLFVQYMLELENSELQEKKDQGRALGMSFYDKSRMFYYVIDKAVSELAWVKTSHFLIDTLREAVDDEIGGTPAVQDFLFSSKSILQPKTADQTIQILLTSAARKSIDEGSAKTFKLHFDGRCVDMLVKGGGQ